MKNLHNKNEPNPLIRHETTLPTIICIRKQRTYSKCGNLTKTLQTRVYQIKHLQYSEAMQKNVSSAYLIFVNQHCPHALNKIRPG